MSDAPASGGGPVPGDDGLLRCPWAATDELLRDYHDLEWGVPVLDERGLFERLVLEGFQAGLSWRVVLAKRPALRAAFADFDPDHVAAMDDDALEAVLADPGVIRNRAKVQAVRTNAEATVALRGDGGLVELVWAHRPPPGPAPRVLGDAPAVTPASERLAAALRARGFRFVGPTTAQATLEAAGLVDGHLAGCHRRGVATTTQRRTGVPHASGER